MEKYKELLNKEFIKEIDNKLIDLDLNKKELDKIEYIQQLDFDEFVFILLLEAYVFANDSKICYDTLLGDNSSNSDDGNSYLDLNEVLMKFIVMEHSFLSVDFLYTQFNARFDIINEVKKADDNTNESLYYLLKGYNTCIGYYINCCKKIKDIFEYSIKFKQDKIIKGDING